MIHFVAFEEGEGEALYASVGGDFRNKLEGDFIGSRIGDR